MLVTENFAGNFCTFTFSYVGRGRCLLHKQTKVRASISFHLNPCGSLLLQTEREKARERGTALHPEPQQPEFRLVVVIMISAGGLPWKLSKPDAAEATAAVSLCYSEASGLRNHATPLQRLKDVGTGGTHDHLWFQRFTLVQSWP